ncbi:hypothetical protein ACN47E_009472 [Coniothyrium glycines]
MRQISRNKMLDLIYGQIEKSLRSRTMQCPRNTHTTHMIQYLCKHNSPTTDTGKITCGLSASEELKAQNDLRFAQEYISSDRAQQSSTTTAIPTSSTESIMTTTIVSPTSTIPRDCPSSNISVHSPSSLAQSITTIPQSMRGIIPNCRGYG